MEEPAMKKALRFLGELIGLAVLGASLYVIIVIIFAAYGAYP